MYNSVSYKENDMNNVLSSINARVSNICSQGKCYHSHNVSVATVMKGIQELNSGKADGNVGHSTDHLINGSHKLHVYLSVLLQAMLIHGCAPEMLSLSTIVPIPKNKRKCLNDSDNYRGIALSNSIGKLFDWVLLLTNKSVFSSSDLQFGYKPKHSTVHCTYVLNEVVNYFNNRGSDVHVVLLDASKAFDRINYVKMFKLLLNKGTCPLVARFLASLYTSQLVRVKWNDYVTYPFNVSNGVKQGGVLSPILFTLYLDELLNNLRKSGYGCHIGNVFLGALAYADDVTLISPSRTATLRMLEIADKFSKEYDVLFNHSKSKLLLFRSSSNDLCPFDKKSISFDGSIIECVDNEKHLGNVIGKESNANNIKQCINDFYGRVNVLIANFKFVSPSIRYDLFKTFCMPLYGVQLWDFSSPFVDRFLVAWRKCIRRLMVLPMQTHCSLLHIICNDFTAEVQLHKRFMRFIHSIMNSNNECVKLCSKIVMGGSRSQISDSINHICHLYNIRKDQLMTLNLHEIMGKIHKCHVSTMSKDDIIKASIINDMLYLRDNLHCTELTSDEIEYIIDDLCTG